MSMGGVDLLQKFQEIYADAGLQLTSHPVPPLRFSFANCQEDVSTSVLPIPYLLWKVIFYIRVLNAPGPVLLGADVHEDLGFVVDHVDGSVFLSHLKLEDTVERLPSRHLALSLCLEDVRAQCNSLTPRTREVDTNMNLSLAHAHGYLKISRNPLLRVHRDVRVISETIPETETDPFSGPVDSCDSVTDELDVDSSVSKTRKRRRLLHKSPVSARFSLYDCDENDDTSAQADCFMPAFAENSDEKQPVVDEVKTEGHEHTVQLLRKGGVDAKQPVAVQQNLSSMGKGKRRNLSSMTKVLSTIVAAAQFLDSSCADCWNRAVRFGRPDLLEICNSNDSPLVNAVEDAGRESIRASFWSGYDLTTCCGRERFYVFCSAKRPRHVWFSSPCRASGASSQRVSRILQGIADVFPRVQALGCHVQFSQPLSSVSWTQKSLLEMTEKTLKAVVNGCARDSQGSLLNQSWQILTTSSEVQRVLNHRPCDQRHRHGSNFINLCVEHWRSSFLRKTVGIPRWAFRNSCIPMTMSDHLIFLLPVLKIWLFWTLHHQGWTLFTVSKCRHWSHLLLRRVRPCLRE